MKAETNVALVLLLALVLPLASRIWWGKFLSGYEGRNKCSFEPESCRCRWITIWSIRCL